jgi:hypothetical protein
MCNTIRTLINKTRKVTQIKFYKAMAVHMLTYRSEIWAITKKSGSKS